ncbi:MAG: iron-containing alcohol dehydrogenase [Burkholderiales bacterium]|jgi:NADP-dependent alcohol dehydrogenase|nr:iron-containing alcohol dehydrogenase [Burkholderiales bacterium]
MHLFTYHNPTTLFFGKGQIIAIRRAIPEKHKVLVLYGGGSVKKNSVLDQVRAALSKHTFTEFGGIEPNPTYETLMSAVELARREGIDYLLAVGGGSVIDGAKFIAAAVPFEGKDPWEIVEKHAPVTKTPLPLSCVLTLPATGSESNNGAVISHAGKGIKRPFFHPQLYPVFAVLDPTTTYTLPLKQIGNGVVDAFVHVAEQYLTTPAQGYVQDYYAEGLLKTLLEVGPQTLQHPLDYEARANFMWVANQALNGLIGVGVPQDWSTHMIGHELTAMYGLDHAQTLAAIFTQNLRVRRKAKRAKLLQYAHRVWQIPATTDEEKAIDMAIDKTAAFFEVMGLKSSLAKLKIEREVIEKLPARLQESGQTALGEHGEVTPVVAKQILMASMEA